MVACGHDVAAPAPPRHMRFLVVEGVPGSAQQLVEYSAPPLTKLRSMPIVDGDTTWRVLLGDGPGDGFYAAPDVHGQLPPAPPWPLVHFDSTWHVAAIHLDTAVAYFPPRVAFTANHQYLVMEIWAPSGGQSLVVLDPETLTEIHRHVLGSTPLLQMRDQSIPTAATGSQVLVTTPGAGECPVALVWWDAATASTSDSTAAPCDQFLLGASSPRRVYGSTEDNGVPVVRLYDVTDDSVVAVADSVHVTSMEALLLTDGRLVVQGIGNMTILDPTTLRFLGRVVTGTGSPARSAITAKVDPTTGDIIGATGYWVEPPGSDVSDGIIIVDPVSLRVVEDDQLGVPISLVGP